MKDINIYAAKTAINRLPKPEIDSKNIITSLKIKNYNYVFEFTIIYDVDGIPDWYLINYIQQMI